MVTQWLTQAPLKLTNPISMPSFYQTLAGVRHLKARSKSGKFDLKTFADIVSPPLPNKLVKGLFSAFDDNSDGHIDFKEISCGISQCCRGPYADRQKFLFKMFDLDKDSLLSTSEVEEMVINFLLVRQIVTRGYRGCDDNVSFDDNEICDVIKRVKSFASNKDRITLSEYQLWSISEVKLSSLLLDLLIQICHVILGLKPATPHEEGKIIHGWVSRVCKLGYTPNNIWYVVSNKWWKKWKNYTRYGLESKENGILKTTSLNGGKNGKTTPDTGSNQKKMESSKQPH